MNVGLGLPVDDPELLLTWAQRADAGPFSTLGLLDRLVYHNPEPLVTLAVLAGATSRVRLQTEVLLAPLREPALLAKQAATLDRLSHGRFTLGIGVGTREDDYLAVGVDFHARGARLDRQMDVLRHMWSGASYADGAGPIGPAPATSAGPRVLFGGFKQAALARVARFGDGFLSAAPLEHTDHLFGAVERRWHEAGRTGRPHLVAQVNVALGAADVIAEAHEAVRAYYGAGDHTGQVITRMLTTPQAIRAAVAAFEDLGADEVMLYCWARDPNQIDRIAAAVV